MLSQAPKEDIDLIKHCLTLVQLGTLRTNHYFSVVTFLNGNSVSRLTKKKLHCSMLYGLFSKKKNLTAFINNKAACSMFF